ncbi:MAG: response regulator transcription factor [Ignavibacteriae bacterium]|nr:response regulator transcription factor [Ignavibacteriota bacterium]
MNTTSHITILLADDHPVYRKGLRDIINEEPAMNVVGETGEGDRVIPLVRERHPDILFLDLSLPGMDGMEIAEQISLNKLPVKVIILTMHNEEGTFNKALDFGVYGYMLKDCAPNYIIDAIKKVHRGEQFICPHISEYLLRRHATAKKILKQTPSLTDLTETERKILKLISLEKTSQQIADMLFISIRTVDTHRSHICEKLNIHGCNALLKFAIENRSSL